MTEATTEKANATSSILVEHGRLPTTLTVMFWIHQVFFGLPSVGLGLDLLITGKATGILNVIGMFLAWIGGSLAWGFGALIHRRYSIVIGGRIAVELPDRPSKGIFRDFAYEFGADGSVTIATTKGERRFDCWDDLDNATRPLAPDGPRR